MSLLAIVGALLVVSGLAGIRLAPRMVEVQKDRGMAPYETDAVTDEDRVRVMKGSGVLITVVGFVLIVVSIF
ncbi:hypothetical protein [Natronosalvus vescus]|uniref:hypothetical protein n=1 Tax=Natronosalvus vescus TaxID=2953881 RepID=UPI0020909BAC|nr:hypothetical protein [Natronosalvus vescus]